MDISYFEKVERAVWQASMERICPLPTDIAGKEEIRNRVKRVLGIENLLPPEVEMTRLAVQNFEGVTVETWRFRSWDGMYGDASLWLPAHISGPLPAVLFHHGHAMEEGRVPHTPWLGLGKQFDKSKFENTFPSGEMSGIRQPSPSQSPTAGGR